MNNIGKSLTLWVVIIVLLVALYSVFQSSTPRGSSQAIAYSDFVAEVERNQVSAVKIKGPGISGVFRDGRGFVTYAPSDPSLVDRLREKNVRIEAGPEQEPTNIFISSIISWLPFLVVCFCLAFSAFYELIEWWVAASTGDDAVAFLATQGDVWDTQWDMFLALLSACASLALLSRLHDRQLARAAR